MPVTLITRPALLWPAREVRTVKVTVTPRALLALSDYGTLTLTVRTDPLWDADKGGRSGADKLAANWADPVADSWAVATSAVGTVAGSIVTFAVTVPGGAGAERYAFDVVAEGGTAGRVQIRDPQWLTVTPTLLDS